MAGRSTSRRRRARLPCQPAVPAQLEAKFRDCAANVVRPIAPQAVEQALAVLSRLEEELDIEGLVGLLTAAQV